MQCLGFDTVMPPQGVWTWVLSYMVGFPMEPFNQ